MKARVKPDHRYAVVTAFTGHEYVKAEWRDVPGGLETEAARHPYLETQAEPENKPAPAEPKRNRRAK